MPHVEAAISLLVEVAAVDGNEVVPLVDAWVESDDLRGRKSKYIS